MQKSFWPTNTEKELYIPTYGGDVTFQEVIDKIKAHFGSDVNLENLSIDAEYIHTECINYDLFDSSDWTNFLCVSLK